MTGTFMQKVSAKAAQGKHLCVGLDPVRGRMPETMSVGQFLNQIVEATIDVAAAFKPNFAFFEGLGPGAWSEFASIVGKIKHDDPTMPIIGDMKRGDIGETNLGTIRAAFEEFEVDAVTVHPYLGQESLQVFLDKDERGIIVLCRTSNPGAGEFQDLLCDVSSDECSFGNQDRVPLYQMVAHRVAGHWNVRGNCGLVVGATYPDELKKVRELAPDVFLLIPGVGTQGGDLEACVRNAYNPKVGEDFAINVSSAVTYAFQKGQFQTEPANFAKAAAAAAEHYDQQIRNAVANTAA